MTGSRRFGSRTAVAAVAATLALAVWAGLGVRSQSRRSPPRLPAELSVGASFADSLERMLAFRGERAIEVDSADAVAAIYLQRLRLGLGSPFRLVDYALRDPLLRSSHRRLVAQAILARTALGEGYQTPGEALRLLASTPDSTIGYAHRALMEQVTQESSSPRAGELALRLAYGIGATSGAVSHRASAVAVGAIALARDRALAMRDVAMLLEEARRQRRDAVDLVPMWRASRRFAVESPLLDPPSAEDERAAVDLLPLLATRLDSLGTSVIPPSRRVLLSPRAAVVASRAVQERKAPPQAPVTVTLGGYAPFVIGAARSAQDRVARSAFIAQSRNEEALAAEFVRLEAERGTAPEAALAVLTSAVAMRAYAQERAWLPGDGGPAVLELQSRLGLASLTFDTRVPPAWRPYFTRMLDEVVTDLRIVFPRLDLTGLQVHFGESPLGDKALALHDPGTRRIYFPLATSAGAIAHELAHDLDWQAARRRYGVKGGYRTDRSARQYEDVFGSTVRKLASAGRPRGESPSGTASALQAERPTEAFARGVDWFVASALAQRGRLNGYLSSVQDEMLTGYASATAPAGGATGAEATLEALREIAQVDPSLLAWYDRAYGSGRRLGVYDAVRRVLLAPLPRLDMRGTVPSGVDAFALTSHMLRSSPEIGAGWRCLLETPSLRGRDAQVTQSAMFLAADARARGLAKRWGEYSHRAPRASWRLRALGGAPWSPAIGDSLVREIRDATLWRAARVDDGRPGSDFAERAERRVAWERCAQGD